VTLKGTAPYATDAIASSDRAARPPITLNRSRSALSGGFLDNGVIGTAAADDGKGGSHATSLPCARCLRRPFLTRSQR